MASAETAETTETTGAAQLLARARDGVLLYGLTPPRGSTTPEQADAVAGAALARLRSVQVDGLILYDVHAEADRSSTPRPFPFMPMMDPAVFLDRHLAGWAGPGRWSSIAPWASTPGTSWASGSRRRTATGC